MWHVDLGFTAASPEQLMDFSAKIFPIAKAEGIGWEGGPCIPQLDPEPPGPLNRAQHAIWKRSRGRVVGNLISDARYWLWRLSR